MSYTPTTSATIRVTTDFGINTSYGTALTSGNVTVNASNYKNAAYQTTAVSTGDTQRGTITNNAIYKMLNVALPSALTGTYTAANGTTYQYKITATNGTSSLSERNIIYTTTWGVGNYNNTWGTTTTLKLTTSNYNTSNITTTYRTTQETATKNYLDTLIGAFVLQKSAASSFTATNGISYYYKISYGCPTTTVTSTSATISGSAVWGLNSSYGQSYSYSGTVTLTPSNVANRETLADGLRDDILEALKAYCNTLIGTVNTPAAITTTFSTVSGQTFYVKTTATGSSSSITATSCAIKYTTVYGLTNSYGTTYSSNVTFTVNASNYKTWTTSYASAVSTEQAKIKNLDMYKMLNLALPSTLSGTYTAASGVGFSYNVSAANGTSSATERNIVYTTKWSLQNYGDVYAEYTLNLTTSNYSTANITSSTATTQLNNLKAYLDTVVPPYTIATPSQVVTYTASSTGITWYIKVRCIPASDDSAIQTTAKTCNVYLSHGTNSSTQDCGPVGVVCGSVSVTVSNYSSFATNLSNKITEVLNTYKADLENVVSTSYSCSVTARTLTTTSGSSIYYTNDGEPDTSSLVAYTSSSTGAWVNSYSGFNMTATLKYGLSNSTSALIYTYTDNTYAVTKSNYKTIFSAIQTHTDTVMKAQDFYKVMNVSVPSGKTGTHTANGKTYYYQIAFTQGSVDTFSNTFDYTVKWGTSSGSYTNLAAAGCIAITRETYSTLSTTASSKVSAEETALKTYLNSIPGVTSATVNVVTDYGISTSYGTALTSGTVTVNASNYKNAAYQTTIVSTGDTQRGTITNTNVYKMLNVQVPDVVTNTSFVATNGITYQYKVTATHGTTSMTQHQIVYTTIWGVGNYNNTWGTKHTLTLTTSNYSTANITTTNRATQVTNTENYLNTLIGTVTTPSDSTTTFSTASGKTFYIKTTFSGSNSSVSATSCTISYTTVYGLSTSYGNTLSSNVTFTVNASNYKTWSTDLASVVSTEQAKVKNLDTYKMLNVALPDVYTKTGFVATNGVTYQYKVTATNGTCDLTQRNIVYTSTWGVGNYNNTWGTKTTLKLTTSNYTTANITTTNRTTQATNTEDYLNTLIGTFSAPTAVTETYSNAPNGITYYIKTTFSGSNNSVSATSGTLTATTTWGTTSGTYDHSFTDGNSSSVSITSSNFANRNTLVTDIGSTQRSNLKAYLDTLIGTVTTPSDSTTTFSTASGQTFYVKTTFTGSNSTEVATSCDIKYTTVYGLTNSYGTTYSSNVTFTVNASNYTSWTTALASAVSTEQAKIKNLDSYKMLNLALPEVLTNTSYVATNGVTYQYKVTATNGTASLTERNIVYTSTWGIGNYNNTWATKHTLTLTTSNYSTSNITTTNRTTQETATKNYLNTLISTVATPSDITTTFSTSSGQTFYVKTTATGSNSSITATSCTIKYTTVYGLTNSYGNTLSTDVTFTVNANNYTSWTTSYASTVASEQDKVKNLATYKMLNVALPSVVTNTNFVANNGTTYQYKVTPSYGTCNLTKSEIIYTSTWGIGNYNNTWDTKHTLTLTTSNYSTANITTTNRSTQVTNTENYLNSFIGTISTPAQITNSFSTASGQTFYVKTTATGSNSSATATSCTIKYTTVYGLSTSYGNTYSTDLTFIVDINNVSSWETDYANTVATEQAKIKNLDTYKMLNLALPSAVTNTSYVAANGTTYQYKVTATNGTCDLTQRNIVYTSTWGVGNYNNTWGTTTTLKLTTSNYNTSNITTTYRTTQETNTKSYLDTLVGSFSAPAAVTETYSDAPNGVTYYIKTTFTGGNSTVTATSATLTATTTWGTTSGTYNQSYSDGNSSSVTITISNLANRETLVKEIGSTQRTNLKAYLDTFIGVVTTPSDVTTTFSTASGQTFYVKTTATGSNSNVTATSCTIKYTTVYGLSNSYGNTYSTDLSFTITSANYKTWTTTYASTVATEQAKIKNLDSYKMLNLALPEVLTNTSYVATNGVTYQYKVTATNGTASLTERNIVYTSTWGIGNYNNTWATKHTLTLTTSNYSTANITTTNRTTQEDATKAYLNTLIGTFSAPSQYTETYVNSPSGVTYYIKTTFSGSNNSLTATSGTLTATTTWGTTSGTYNQSYSDGNSSSVTITPSNFSTRNTLVGNIGSTQRSNLKNYLDTLIGIVTTPADSTTTFSTASGQTFYVKTTFTGGNTSVTATGTTIKYTTVYGLSNSYGNTLSTDIEFVVTPDNYATWESDITTAVSTEQAKVKNLDTYKMLNVALPSTVTNTSYVATNGVTYQYKVTATNGTCDFTQRNIVYTTTWGVGNYNNTYATYTLKLTTSNYSTANITTTNRTTQVTNIEAYLNTLISTVTTPSDSATVFATNSGKTFYVKTTFTGSNSSITATSCVIKYTTVYGLTNSYGNTYSTDVTFTVTASNYKTRTTDIASAVTTEQNKIKNLDSYKMLNVALPSSHSDTYQAVNGKTYSYTTTYTQGTANLTQNNITCTTKYTRQDNTVKTYNSTTRKLTTSNYSSASTNLASDMSTQEQNLKDYLDTLLVMPTKYSNTYTKGGCKYYFEIYYTILDEESHDVTATAKVDLLTLKSSTTTCTDMDDFNTKKTTIQSTKISEMENAVSDSPSNTSVKVQGLTIATSYTKNAITASSVNGDIYGSVSVEGSIVYGPIDFGELNSFTNYKFVYTTITNDINNKVSEITDLLNNSLPVSGSYTYQTTDNFGCDISYTYTRNILLYSLSISIDGVELLSETQHLNINEAFKIESRMKYLLSKYESKIKDVTPKDIEQTYNGVTVSRKFSKNPSSNVVTCDLYVDGVKKNTYTGTFDLSQSLLKESLQSLGEGDYTEYINNAKSLNISVTTTTTFTANGKTYNARILTEKVGSKIRVYRIIGNMKTNYIDVPVDYLNASTTKTAIQTAANKLLQNLNTLIDFYRPPSEAALVELLKIVTV